MALSVEGGQAPDKPFLAGQSFGVLALAPSFLKGLWRPEHFLLGAAAKYVPIVWMDPPYRRQDFLRGRQPHAKSSAFKKPAHVIHYAPPRWLPHFHRPAPLRRALFRLRVRSALSRLRAMDKTLPVVLSFWRPWPLVDFDKSQFSLITYHITDLFRLWGFSLEVEESLVKSADHTFASSRGLFDRFEPLNPNCTELPNGVDFELFSRPVDTAPPDLQSIPSPRLVYAGVIKQHIQLDLLAAIAERMPDCSIVMVGPVSETVTGTLEYEELRRRPNVHLLGAKDVEELPAYLQHCQIGLLPYQVNEYTRHISPMKLYEYLAAGLPCVGSRIEPLIAVQDTVRLADDPAAWIEAIADLRRKAHQDPNRRSASRRIASQHDWDALARRYLNTLSDRLTTRREAS